VDSRLDIACLERIHLSRTSVGQDLLALILLPNIRWFPGVQIDFEHFERVPEAPVIFAMNHTDRFNYLPLQWRLRSEMRRYTATWVKGKYYEKYIVGKALELANQLPTVSRGYLISKDFLTVMGRPPRDEEYRTLRAWVDAVALAESSDRRSATDDRAGEIEKLPERLLNEPRDVFGYAFDPQREDYAGYIVSLFRAMMGRFVDLNRRVFEVGLDMLIMPQGTRSLRLSRGHIGLGQTALAFKQTIVPIGCNGSDDLYRGSLPWAKAGRVVYRFGEPIPYEELSAYHIDEPFEPFTPMAEKLHRDRFQGVVDLVMDRINSLLDEPYQYRADRDSEGVHGSERFV
jgi:hypothetical protein